MDLKFLKDEQIEIGLRRLVEKERGILVEVILYIQEVNRRRIHLESGYPTLLMYLVKELKYSQSAAQRRIEAARLNSEIPEVAEKIQSGDLNLSQVGEIQRSLKIARRVHQVSVPVEVKEEIVEAVLNSSAEKTQQTCAEILAIPILDFETVRIQKDGSKKIEITLSQDQFEKYEQIKDLLAHRNFEAKRNQDMADVLETAFDFIIKELTQPFTEANNQCVTDNETWKSLTQKRKQQIKQRDQCCQYIEKKTGRQCKTKFNMQTDHIQPIWDGGSNKPTNQPASPLRRSQPTPLSKAKPDFAFVKIYRAGRNPEMCFIAIFAIQPSLEGLETADKAQK